MPKLVRLSAILDFNKGTLEETCKQPFAYLQQETGIDFRYDASPDYVANVGWSPPGSTRSGTATSHRATSRLPMPATSPSSPAATSTRGSRPTSSPTSRRSLPARSRRLWALPGQRSGGEYRALPSTGTSRLQVFLYGILPQSARGLLSFVLMHSECARRNASVIGWVGAGGLGDRFDSNRQWLQLHQASTYLWAMIALTVAIDRLSRRLQLRRRRC